MDVHLAAVSVHYATASGMVRALDGVTLDVEGGTSVAVVGPSGGGKSTLLGLLGGLDVPTTGTVRVGEALSTARGRHRRQPAHRRGPRPDLISSFTERQRTAFRRGHVGVVYQNDNLLPFLTVAENLALQQALTRDHRPERSDALRLLTRLGLQAEADRVPDQLSGGQRQRVAIARAVVSEPKLLLADEPTGALDPGNAAVVIELLLEVRHYLGATLVMATHDRSAARRMDRIVELRDGRVTADRVAAHAD